MLTLLNGPHLDSQPVTHVRTHAAAVTNSGEVLLRRAEHLTKEDQMLIELFVGRQMSHRRLAMLLDLPHGTISRRLAQIGRRLHDPLIVRLLDGPCPLERIDRQIAIGHFLNRRPQRELSTIHQLPLAEISRRLQFVRGWFKGASLKRNDERGMRNAK